MFSRAITWFRGAFQDLKRDIKSTQWLRVLGWYTGVIWAFALIAGLIVICALPRFGDDDNACPPDRVFRLYPEKYSVWSSTAFFQITLGGGTLSFAQAKAIDVVWDIAVGRGGQSLLALVSWREFRKYLTICMESEPVTYQLFRTTFIENDASMLSTARTIKSFLCQRRLRSKVAMTFMIATMLLILAFPTLMSAMSGYDSNVSSRILDRDNNLIGFSSFHRVLYVIHDGWRINLTGNHWIMENIWAGDPVLRSYSFCERSRICSDAASVSQYVEAYGIGGRLNQTTIFHNQTSNTSITVSAPSLNISVYQNGSQSSDSQLSTGVPSPTWVRDNQTFDLAYVTRNGQCQSLGTYLWGFSFLQLFVCMILLLAWTLGIYALWLHTHYTMALRKQLYEEISGEHRAILELAAAMQRELDVEHIDPLVLREKQLKERINIEILGGRISYVHLRSKSELYSMWKAVKQWFKAEKWWFLAMLTVTIFCLTGWMLWVAQGGYSAMLLWFWSFSVCFGQLGAFCIGTSVGSRLLIISSWAIMGATIISSLAGAIATHPND